MKTNTSEFYRNISLVLIGIIAFFYILYIGRDLIIPLVLAALIAIMLNPVVNFFHRRLNRVLAILSVMFLAGIIFSAVLYFIANQLVHFSEAAPLFEQRFAQLWTDTLNWIVTRFDLTETNITDFLMKAQTEIVNQLGKVIPQTIGTVGGTASMFILLPVYVFMMLLYKPMLIVFIEKLFAKDQQQVVDDILFQTQKLIQSYLVGLLLEIAVITLLNSIGLLIIGIEYAVLLAFVGALLNLIPYLGAIIAMLFMTTLAFATQSLSAAIWVAALYLFVQAVDNNFLMPKIVGSKVKINAFVSILAVLLGGAIWGIAGMFLAIPLIAIAKVIFDRVDSLQPLGYILGDEMPETNAPKLGFKSWKRKSND